MSLVIVLDGADSALGCYYLSSVHTWAYQTSEAGQACAQLAGRLRSSGSSSQRAGEKREGVLPLFMGEI